MVRLQSVRFQVPAHVAFDYLVDPQNRPEWQSSLRRVVDVHGGIGVGQTWVDVTLPGFRPRMQTSGFDRPRAWTEVGTWRTIAAELTLNFVPATRDAVQVVDVVADFRVSGQGPSAFPAQILERVAPPALRADLRKAARICAKRQGCAT